MRFNILGALRISRVNVRKRKMELKKALNKTDEWAG